MVKDQGQRALCSCDGFVCEEVFRLPTFRVIACMRVHESKEIDPPLCRWALQTKNRTWQSTASVHPPVHPTVCVRDALSPRCPLAVRQHVLESYRENTDGI